MSATDDRLAELEHRNAEMARELEELRRLVIPIGEDRSDPRTGTDIDTESDTGTVSRRHALRTAGAVAAGALVTGVAAAVATATPAAAAPLSPVTGNPAITATADPTSGTAIRADSTGGNAVSGNTVTGTGVHGGAEAAGSFGVVGVSISGIGVAAASGSGTALYANSSNAIGARINGTTLGAQISGNDAALQLMPQNDAPPTRTTVTNQVGTITVDQYGSLWVCVTGGTPGTWRQIAGTSTAGSFHAVTPGRVYDSRAQWPFNERISTGQTRNVNVAAKRDQNGVIVNANFIPQGAQAVFANITVVDTAFSGWLVANPGGITTVSASTINWSGDGQIIANGVALAINPTNRNLTVIAGGPGSTDFLIDITGYWL